MKKLLLKNGSLRYKNNIFIFKESLKSKVKTQQRGMLIATD